VTPSLVTIVPSRQTIGLLMITMQYVKTATKLGWKQMSEFNPPYMEIVSTLKYIRLLKGYTLEHVEVITNGEFTKEAVGSYERNSRNITLRRLLKLCDVYGVSIDTVIRHVMYDDPIHVLRRRNYELRTTA
jgi:hypothetical protein